MATYNKKEKMLLNNTVALCREYRFHESRKNIITAAGLPTGMADLPISELRTIIDNRVKNKVVQPVVSEMLRIDSTFRYIRDIHHYNQEQVKVIISNLDQTIPYLNPANSRPVIKKMENIYHLSGEKPLYHLLNKDHKPIDQVRRLDKLIKDSKNPQLTPNYIEAVKQEISAKGFNTINQELEKPHTLAERIRLNEEKLYLIHHTGWNRSQKYLAKSQTYNQLHTMYAQNNEPQKSNQAHHKCTKFYSSYKQAMSFNPDFKRNQNREEWLYK